MITKMDLKKLEKLTDIKITLIRREGEIRGRIIQNDYITKYPFNSLWEDLEKLEKNTQTLYKVTNYYKKINK